MLCVGLRRLLEPVHSERLHGSVAECLHELAATCGRVLSLTTLSRSNFLSPDEYLPSGSIFRTLLQLRSSHVAHAPHLPPCQVATHALPHHCIVGGSCRRILHSRVRSKDDRKLGCQLAIVVAVIKDKLLANRENPSHLLGNRNRYGCADDVSCGWTISMAPLCTMRPSQFESGTKQTDSLCT